MTQDAVIRTWILAAAVAASSAAASSAALAMGVPKPPSPQPDNRTSSYQNGNLYYDLSRAYDGVLRSRILAALKLGHAQAAAGRRDVGRLIATLRGRGQARTIRFFSNAGEFGYAASGAPAAATWRGPYGANDMDSDPALRTDLRVYLRPGQDHWYAVSNVWHELLHATLRVTHHQTTPEGTIPLRYVNDGVWYPAIKAIMFDFPRYAVDPATGSTVELYNPENNPWS